MRIYNRRVFEPDEKFNQLTIKRVWLEEYYGRKGQLEYRCECECECGGKTIAWSRHLISGHKKSCGCLTSHKRWNNKHWGWKGCGEISGTTWKAIQATCKKRRRVIPFDITIEQVWDLFLKQDRKCAISGVEIGFSKRDKGRYGPTDNTASLDRIDSSGGYTTDNIQWVHKIVQGMKMALPQDEFIKWCKVIAAKI